MPWQARLQRLRAGSPGELARLAWAHYSPIFNDLASAARIPRWDASFDAPGAYFHQVSPIP
jgi:hypothetical protein